MNLNRFHGNDLGAVIRTDKFCPADAQFAYARLDFVILHSPRFIGGGAVHKFIAERYGGWDVPHLTGGNKFLIGQKCLVCEILF